MKKGGIFLPIHSLPSKHGVGGFEEVHKFITFMTTAQQKYWQILPLNPVSLEQQFCVTSVFAGNPLYVDFKQLVDNGLIKQKDYDNWCKRDDVNWQFALQRANQLMFYAFKTFTREQPPKEYLDFVLQNKNWLSDYCLFKALKGHFTDASWDKWPDKDIQKHTPQAVEYYTDLLSDEIDLYKFEQFVFYSQWQAIRQKLHDKSIMIVGTLPFYVAFDSADCWAHQDLFLLKEDCTPKVLVNAFGRPVAYDWKAMRQSGFEWWLQRADHSRHLYDMTVVQDFAHFYQYPVYGKKAKAKADWSIVPKLTQQHSVLIAEDYSNKKIARLIHKQKGLYTTTAQQEAFVPSGARHKIANHKENSIAYLGTNHTNLVYDWFICLDKKTQNKVLREVNVTTGEKLSWSFVKYLYSSKAIAMVSMNELSNNVTNQYATIWQYMAQNKDFSAENAEKLKFVGTHVQ